MKNWVLAGCIILGLLASAIAQAAERGPVTNLPLPRFVSLKASEANVRRGPSLSHRIDWVFKHRNMPLKVVAEHGHWRRVVDQDGAGGWVHYTLISGVRTVRITESKQPLYKLPEEGAAIAAYSEAGVIGRLGTCNPDWCRVTVSSEAGSFKGWVQRDHLWGLLPGEVRN